MLWIIQDSKGLHYNWTAMYSAVKQIGSHALYCAINEAPARLEQDNIIIGGDDFLERMARYGSKEYRMLIFNYNWLNVSSYKRLWDDDFLNFETQEIQYADLLALPEKEYFIRPIVDSKCIDGGIYLLPDDIGRFAKCNTCTNSAVPCMCVGPAHKVYTEWRFVIIHHEVITGCQYCKNGESAVSANVPKHAVAFVSQIVDKTAEHGPYVLDIAETDIGLKVVEANVFNASNYYNCNRAAIALSLEYYIQNTH